MSQPAAPRDDNSVDHWLATLEARHLAELTFPEVSRALRALSSTYVERRQRLASGAALAGAGKRAAFALFYGPLHFLLVDRIVDRLPGARELPPTLVDLGCGTGAGGVAWALAAVRRPRILGIDTHPWPLAEAAWTYRAFGLSARTRRGDLVTVSLPEPPLAILAAFAVNELSDAGRDALLARLLDRAAAGDRILIVEPVAGFIARGWRRWCDAFAAHGGRADEWRFRVELPPLVAKLDRAAGLHHRELTGRSIWIAGDRASRAVRPAPSS